MIGQPEVTEQDSLQSRRASLAPTRIHVILSGHFCTAPIAHVSEPEIHDVGKRVCIAVAAHSLALAKAVFAVALANRAKEFVGFNRRFCHVREFLGMRCYGAKFSGIK